MKEVVINAFDQDSQVISDAVNYGVDANSRFNGEQGTNNQNGQFQYVRYFPKSGVYKLRLNYISDTAYGIWNIKLDSQSLWSNLDMYNATTILHKIQEIPFNISRGYHTINFTNNGKNASASNYTIRIHFLQFDFMGDYPNYQEDQSAIGQEGSLVLLGTHVAQVAESSFQFNFANVDLKNLYSEIEIIIQGETTASLALQMLINGVSTGYYANGWTSIITTLANVQKSNQTSLELLGTNIITTGNAFEAKITLRMDYSNNYINGTWSGGVIGSGSTGGEAGVVSASNIISSIKLQTSASTWITGTQIAIYGKKKK